MRQQNLFLNLPAPVRFIIVFLAVMALFACIEILPLHYGAQHLAWGQLKPEILKHLPRMLLIGGGVALILTIRGKSEKQ